jgi:hypothetical protein
MKKFEEMKLKLVFAVTRVEISYFCLIFALVGGSISVCMMFFVSKIFCKVFEVLQDLIDFRTKTFFLKSCG